MIDSLVLHSANDIPDPTLHGHAGGTERLTFFAAVVRVVLLSWS